MGLQLAHKTPHPIALQLHNPTHDGHQPSFKPLAHGVLHNLLVAAALRGGSEIGNVAKVVAVQQCRVAGGEG